MISLNVNGKNYKVDVSEDVPLLWVIRDYLKLTGTKFGLWDRRMRCMHGSHRWQGREVLRDSCWESPGEKITTIEGLPEIIL